MFNVIVFGINCLAIGICIPGVFNLVSHDHTLSFMAMIFNIMLAISSFSRILKCKY